MRKIFGKNRLAIVALALMIGIAGYMSFAGDSSTEEKDTTQVISYDEASEEKLAAAEEGVDTKEETDANKQETVADNESDSDADKTDDDGAETENEDADTEASKLADNYEDEEIELNEGEDSIGDAVLTSAQIIKNNISTAKLNREQSRSKSREALMEIIGDEAISEEAQKEAADTYVKLSDTIELESDLETILAAKGYDEVLVSVGEDSVDISIYADSVSDQDRAQIEDIVTRKTGIDIRNIAISIIGDK
jgi:stage III sporulation protein AH